jgi:hypothetical protein
VCGLALAGCNRPNDDANHTTGLPDTLWAPLVLTFQHQWAGQALSAADTFALDARAVTVSTAKLILSNFRLVLNDSTEWPIAHPGFVVNGLAAPGGHTFALPSVPVGTYRGIRFAVGLDSTTNHQDPTLLAQEHPLNRPDMHWSWAPTLGYVFLKLEGYADQTAAGDGSAPLQWFTLHLATDEMYTQIRALDSLPLVVTQQATPIIVGVNWERLFQDVELPLGFTNHGSGRAYRSNFNHLFFKP